MSKAEEDDRYGIDFAEVFNFDGEYAGYISELKGMIEKGINSPAVKRAQDAISKGGKSILETIYTGLEKAEKNLHK